jgi:hypothetical protein
VQPSSLVFLAIVALWAAYLLPQWIRRRDLFAHWREEERDSGGQRILGPRRRREGHGRSTEPLLGSSHGSGPVPDPSEGTDTDDGPAVPPADPGSDNGVAGQDSPPTTVPERSTPPVVTSTSRAPAARRRAQVLAVLGGLWALSGIGSLIGAPIAVPAVMTVLLVAYLVALRAVAVREAARRVESARERPRTARPVVGTSRASQRRPVRPRSAAEARKAAAVVARRRTAAAKALAGEDPSAVDKLTEDSSWEPTPVPVPTYTLKPMAPRPEPAALDLSTGGFDSAAPVEATVSAEGKAGTEEDSGASRDAVAAASGAEEPGAEGTSAADGEGGTGGARRPWGEDRQWADDLDLDAVLARRRAVNG